MHVEINNEQEVLKLDNQAIANAVAMVILTEGQRCDEVAVHFVSVDAIKALHQRFFNDPSPTDCISLPMDDMDDGSYRHLGEVFVCPEVALEYVQTHGGNVLEEVFLYVIHGLLHLMGYDDIKEKTVAAMRAAEQRHLSTLRQVGMLPLQ